MDLYLPSAEPGLTLQEMIDCDIKSGFEEGFPLDSLDLSGMSTLDAELDLKNFEPLFDPLDRLDDMDAIIKDEVDDYTDEDDASSRRHYEEEDDTHDTVSSWMNMSSMSNYNLDIENSIMVDPSSVIPSTLPSRSQLQVDQKHPVTLRSISTSTSSVVSPIITSSSTLKTPLLSSTISSVPPASSLLSSSSQTTVGTTNTQFFRTRISSSGSQSAGSQMVLCPSNSPVSTSSTIISTSLSNTRLLSVNGLTTTKMINGDSGIVGSNTTPILASTIASPHNTSSSVTSSISSAHNSSSITTNGFHHHHHPNQHSTISHQNHRSPALVARIGPVHATKTTNGIISTSKSKHAKFRRDKQSEEKVFPKPAYSYSCLIALALKNSSSGSLPVSEIYNFMCEHFPYFRTAPNGWKNSVRHNLSLNKCFEKIEKPVVSGGNQRKGCLWALNPDRAHKMDDEVQKWSKKGLQEIKQSMTYPETLESLERGEMKFETSSGASSCSEDEEDFEEGDPLTTPEITATQTIHPFKIAAPVSSTILSTGGLKGQQPRVIAGNVRSISYIQPGQQPQTNTLHVSASQQQQMARTQGATQIHIRKPIQMTSVTTSSNSPHDAVEKTSSSEFNSHPSQTLSEINIQSNGSIVDDFGNEITIEGDMGILNPSSSSSSGSPSGSLILRQTSLGTSIRAAPLSGTSFYTTSSPLSSPHHQSTLNRLVLTSAKPS